MRTHYDKLVRDRIPEIIHASGRDCGTQILSEDQYRAALHAKIIEEATELAHAPDEDLVTELADMREVLDALIDLHGLSEVEIQSTQANRRAERGGFLARIKLLWTE